jgi:(1->4)-alpha-D-glucan 1-alpha-D-glucosylmutase
VGHGDVGVAVTPRATYRLQLGAGLDFAAVAELGPYLARLGVSHVYLSPPFQARRGSTHGYDVADHRVISAELGGRDGFAAMAGRLAELGLEVIVDFVPNHMGVGHDNPWWCEVLAWGPRAPHAETFDIDWRSAVGHLEGKVLVPMLGDHYGEILARGELAIGYDGGELSARYFEHRFPLSPPTYAMVFETDTGVDALDAILAELRGLGAVDSAAVLGGRFIERAAELCAELATLAAKEQKVAAAIETALAKVNNEPSRNRLHEILEAQHFRLAYWRVAADEINYRRFFNINELAGLRVEISEVFDRTHSGLLGLIDDGLVSGVRVDHIDGLFDPGGYLRELRAAARERGLEPYVVVEKILAEHEHMRDDWEVEGTTGYEFLSEVVELLVDPAGEARLRGLYRRQAGAPLDLDESFYRAKIDVIDGLLSAELNVLAAALDRISERNRSTRDFTRTGLREALRQVVACFPVYRTYLGPEGAPGDDDRRDIAWAVAAARRRVPRIDASVFDFVEAAMLCELPGSLEAGYDPLEVRRFALKLQQYTGPVMAKAIEDTAFYRHPLLLALNDVGTDPRRFGVSAAGFHLRQQRRAQRHPASMLTTSTHDTKRGEDARARIAALSEVAGEWSRRVRRWDQLNRSRRQLVGDRRAPSRLESYLLYQTMIGSWPVDPAERTGFAGRGEQSPAKPSNNDFAGRGEQSPAKPSNNDFAERMAAYAIKALREAKQSSSWSRPDGAYEEAVAEFVRRVLDGSGPNVFLDDFAPFADEIAARGAVNSLTQLVLKLTCPGVPDVYQGSELWDLSLVDPDNRRPVDFARRAALLDHISGADPAALLASWRDGRIKAYVLCRLLSLRAEHPELFAAGDYRPLSIDGASAGSAIAFERSGGGASITVCAARLAGSVGIPPIGDRWGDTAIAAGVTGTEILTGAPARPRLAELLSVLPVAVVMRG